MVVLFLVPPGRVLFSSFVLHFIIWSMNFSLLVPRFFAFGLVLLSFLILSIAAA
jgi:hypothetical protein